MPLPWILMWLLSDHNDNSNSNSILSNMDTTTVEIAPGDRAPTEATTTTTDRHRTKAPTPARNGKFCIYCKILNHTQEECRKRINDKKPCVNGKGQLYWPNINNIDTNNVQAGNNDSNYEVGSVFQSRAS